MPTTNTGLRNSDMNHNGKKKEAASSVWRRLIPAWIGLAIGTFLCIFFLLFPKPVDGPSGFDAGYYQTPDGKGGFMPLTSVPFIMPVAGFLVGFAIFIYRKAKKEIER